MINITMKNFQENIITAVNQSQLPAGCIVYILENILRECKEIFQYECEKELKELKESTNNDSQGENDVVETTPVVIDLNNLQDEIKEEE